jgi:phosphodiesterase/alkaline phosphatase D-like protein
MGKPYVRREAQVKAEILQIVERAPLPVRQTLKELQIAPSTYYRWKCQGRRESVPVGRSKTVPPSAAG